MGTLEQAAVLVPEAHDALLVLERMNEGFYAIDAGWRFLYVNRSAEAFWGLDRADMLGKSMLELFTRFPGSPAHDAHRLAMETGEPSRVETMSTATGAPVELRLFPRTGGLSVYFQDIAKRREMELELKARDELLTLAELSAGIGVWSANLRDGTVVATPQFFKLLGLEPEAGPVSQEVARGLRHPEDRERVMAGFQEALASGSDAYESEYRIIRPSGEQRWIFGRGRVVRDAEGKPWRYSGVDLDITDRRAQEDHLRLVMGELLHRTNNLLTVVQGLARQTAHGSTSLEEITPAINARLQGLGVSSSLLAQQDWHGAALDQLVRAQVAPFADEHRFELSGPRVVLSPKAVQNVGLALHELCTNAIKYGALSVGGGTVKVAWEVRRTDDSPVLHVVWTELGGPAVPPPTRAGFGRVVSEQMIAAALGAAVKTSFDPAGVEWVLDLPATEFTAESG
jgi:PAS domain S-box-containing protein